MTSRVAPGWSARWRCSSARVSRRVRASSAASGSSSSSSVGSTASARASATRWACPPDSCRGLRPGVLGQADPVQPARRPAARAVAPVDAAAARAERDVVQRGQVREEQVVLEHHADRPALGGCPHADGRGGRGRGRRGVMCPAVSGCSPARARSAVVLPAPLGPSSATTSPGGDAQVDVEAEARRGRRRGARRAAVAVTGWRSIGRAGGQDRHRDGEQDQAEHDRGLQVGLQGQVDGQRHGLGAAGEVAGEGDGGAELAQRPGPAQHRAGGDAGRDQRQGDLGNVVHRPAPRVAAASS